MAENNNSKKNTDKKNEAKKTTDKVNSYYFGGIVEFSLDKIEEEILNESLYLDVFAGSDIQFKKNVENLNQVLPLIMKIDCIKFDYDTNSFSNKNFDSKKQIGVIANQIAEYFPELVKRDEDGYLFVNYSQLSTLAIQAVKDLSQDLDNTNKKISDLEEQVKSLINKSNIN